MRWFGFCSDYGDSLVLRSSFLKVLTTARGRAVVAVT